MSQVKFAVKVRDYVVSVIDHEGGEAEKLQFFFDTFKAEYDNPYNRQRYKTLQNMLREYLAGLPSCINIEFTYFEIENLLREWGYLNEYSTEKKVEKEIDAYWNYISMALIVEARKHKIKSVEGL